MGQPLRDRYPPGNILTGRRNLMLDLFVSIVNHNHADLLPPCLDSVFKSLRDLKAQVAVLDNASTDGSAQLVAERYPEVELITREKHYGFSANHNHVVKPHLGEARYYLLLNDDTVVEGQTLKDMAKFMDENPQVGIVGARLVYPDGSVQASYGAFPGVWDVIFFIWGLGSLLPKHKRQQLKGFIKTFKRFLPAQSQVYLDNWVDPPRQPLRVDWVSGACIMVRAEMIEQVGLLDEESYFMYFEETDWCKRAVEKGWQVYYLPETCVRHFSSASRSRITAFAFIQSGCRYFEKHGTRRDVLTFKAAIALKAVINLIWGGIKWIVKPGSRQKTEDTLGLQNDFLRLALIGLKKSA